MHNVFNVYSVGGWVGGDNPPIFHAFLESYCSLENPLKKGSPPLALAHYVLYSVCVCVWGRGGSVFFLCSIELERVPEEASAASNHIVGRLGELLVEGARRRWEAG